MSKCLINGTVSYQQGPCPTDPVRRHPTVEELNAAEKKKRAAAAAAASSSAIGAARAAPAAPQAAVPTVPSTAPPAVASGYRCDGRQYCSQMTSCAEAKYFLAHCPTVQMDGDGDGIPCERQWCNR